MAGVALPSGGRLWHPRRETLGRPSGQRVVHERDVVLVDDRAPEAGVYEAHPEPVAVPEGAAEGRDRAGEEHDGGPLAEPPGEAAQPVRRGEQRGERILLVRLPRAPGPDPCSEDEVVDMVGDLREVPSRPRKDVGADMLG